MHKTCLNFLVTFVAMVELLTGQANALKTKVIKKVLQYTTM